MLSRRQIVYSLLGGGAVLGLAPLVNPFGNMAFAQTAATPKKTKGGKHYKLPFHSGMGGAPLGNGSKEISDADAIGALQGAWDKGARYFDTSPFYGFGLSERRFGAFLHNKKRGEYILSTKVGRVFKASKPVAKKGLWINPSPFEYSYDYSAAGIRRSIEDSLQRMGVESIDIVFIHDLNEGNTDLGPKWKEHFEIAVKGAMPELTKMREEGLIKAWGLGVNEPEPIMRCLEVADPDIMLAATQYSLIKHEEALNKTFPACAAKDVSVVIGAPLNNGFISGADRYDYSGKIPPGAKDKRSKMNAIAKEHGIDLRTAALQFCAANPAVAAVIPGCRNGTQSAQNEESMKVKIPAEFWTKMKAGKLISENAPVPKA